MEKKIIIFAASLIFASSGCATVQTYDSLNNMTSGEVMNLYGKPDKIYTHGSKRKYGADEAWYYEARTGYTSKYYFKDGIVVEKDGGDEDLFWGLTMELSNKKERGKTKEEIIYEMGKATYISKEPSDLKYGADEVWIYHPHSGNTYIYFRHGKVIKAEHIDYGCL